MILQNSKLPENKSCITMRLLRYHYYLIFGSSKLLAVSRIKSV